MTATPLPFGIGGVFYINLDHRLDRKEQIEGELAAMGLPFERFPAIKKKPGILGCGQSHLAVLKEAQRRGYESVLIFEDDFQFLVDKDTFWKTFNSAAESISTFDVIMLGYYVQKSEAFSDLFEKVHDGQTASGYIVHSRMYTKLIQLYEWAMPLLESTGQHWIYANDQIWKRLQPTSEWYAFKTRIGKQRASYSDCGESQADYGI
jgi:GR25 family glycosyltransferase involved in LPS biosynthesis